MPQSRGLVIVVEDDAAVRKSLKFALEMEGLTVRAYESAAALLAVGDLPAEGCLVIDYYMPAMNGLDLVSNLRGRRVDLPVILITARATREMRRHAASAGIRMVLEKPLQDSALLDGIRGALGRPH
jgi:two-component system, LuxR family, response regulator FixJ